MTTISKQHSVKSSFTVKPDLYKKMLSSGNKSRIVNEALALYFERNDYMEKAEEKYWNEKIRDWLSDIENWDTMAINPNGEKLSKELIKKALWS